MFGYIKVAKPTAAHGATLAALKYAVTREKMTIPASRKKPAHEALMFKISCEGFVEGEVDATSEEALRGVVSEVVKTRKLFSYKTPFRVSAMAKPVTGLAATALLDKLAAGLSCLIAYSNLGDGEVSPRAADILGQLGIDPASL